MKEGGKDSCKKPTLSRGEPLLRPKTFSHCIHLVSVSIHDAYSGRKHSCQTCRKTGVAAKPFVESVSSSRLQYITV